MPSDWDGDPVGSEAWDCEFPLVISCRGVRRLSWSSGERPSRVLSRIMFSACAPCSLGPPGLPSLAYAPPGYYYLHAPYTATYGLPTYNCIYKYSGK